MFGDKGLENRWLQLQPQHTQEILSYINAEVEKLAAGADKIYAVQSPDAAKPNEAYHHLLSGVNSHTVTPLN